MSFQNVPTQEYCFCMCILNIFHCFLQKKTLDGALITYTLLSTWKAASMPIAFLLYNCISVPALLSTVE